MISPDLGRLAGIILAELDLKEMASQDEALLRERINKEGELLTTCPLPQTSDAKKGAFAYLEMIKCCDFYDEYARFMIRNSFSSSEREACALEKFDLALSLELHRLAERTKNLARSANLPFEHLVSLDDFYYAAQATTKIGGISLADLFLGNGKLSSVDFFNFCQRSLLAYYSHDYKDLLEEQKGVLFQTYPYKTKDSVAKASSAILALIVDDKDYYPNFNVDNFKERRSYKRVLDIYRNIGEKFHKLQSKAYSTITNPNCSDFDDLKKSVWPQIKKDDDFLCLSVTLMALGCVGDAEMVNLSKIAFHWIEQGVEVEFFRDLIKAIQKTVEMNPYQGDIFTKEDFATFQKDEAQSEDDTPITLPDLSGLITKEAQIKNGEEYFVNPNLVEWPDLVRPTIAGLSFDKYTPLKFKFILVYRSEGEETSRLIFDFNLKKGKEDFSWNFLESTRDFEAVSFYQAILRAAKRCLISIKESKIVEDKDEKPLTGTSSKNKGKTINPLAPKGTGSKSGSTLSNATLIPQREFTPHESIKNIIVIPEPEDSVWKIKDPDDCQKVLKDMARFNETGYGGDFKLIVVKGKKRYRLRIGKMRVDLDPIANNQEKTQVLQVTSITYMKDAYR